MTELEAFNERGNVEAAKSTRTYEVLQKIKNGSATQGEKDYVFKQLQSNIYSRKKVPIMGVFIDFSPYLTRYFVKTRDYGVQEIWAFNRTNIRNEAGYMGISEISEPQTGRVHKCSKCGQLTRDKHQ